MEAQHLVFNMHGCSQQAGREAVVPPAKGHNYYVLDARDGFDSKGIQLLHILLFSCDETKKCFALSV